MKPPFEKNFCRVFEVPDTFPTDFCFCGGLPTTFLMVDWFNPWPNSLIDSKECNTWEDVVDILLPYIKAKKYIKPGRRYIIITEFDKILMFTG